MLIAPIIHISCVANKDFWQFAADVGKLFAFVARHEQGIAARQYR